MMKKPKNKYLISIIFFVVFLVFLFDVAVTGFTFGIDNAVNESMEGFRNSFLTSFMVFFTNLGNYYVMIALFLILAGLFLFLKKRENALLLSVCMAVGYLLSELLKIIVQRARPENLLESDYSFPSQHAMMSAIFFLIVLYSFKEDIKNKILKNIFIFACIFMFLAIGISRIYLGVHYVSDVIAGFALGIALVNFIMPYFFKK